MRSDTDGTEKLTETDTTSYSKEQDRTLMVRERTGVEGRSMVVVLMVFRGGRRWELPVELPASDLELALCAMDKIADAFTLWHRTIVDEEWSYPSETSSS